MFALPELNAIALGVVVCWGRSISLLFLVVTSQPELNNGADSEDETAGDKYIDMMTWLDLRLTLR
jgi:hypothetical protein